MTEPSRRNRKIINDPIYGFISFPHEILFDLIEHPYFQRLRRIKQLGLTHFVYPGANHTRFQHALGATYLMDMALNVISSKGHIITNEESEAAQIAILLHDIGHAPFSHTLENTLIEGINHEMISLMLMNVLNEEMDGRLSLAIDIFTNKYPKKFLHQLVSSQLDMDRLDYLNRDSFFTGVSEGVIGYDRIIKMLNIVDDQLVVEAKGIFSIEKFLLARRLMYWQVYLHKTVISAENLLVKIFERAKYLARNKVKLFATPELEFFLYDNIQPNAFSNITRSIALDNFVALDDNDIICSIKNWMKGPDETLSILSKRLINRQLFKIIIQNLPFEEDTINLTKQEVAKYFPNYKKEINYFVFANEITSNTYSWTDDKINILFKDGSIMDVIEASEILDLDHISKLVKKHFLCHPKLFDKNK